MSKLSIESGLNIIQENREIIYRLPSKYKYLNHYLKGSLRETLLKILNFIKDKNIILYNHKYSFFIDNESLTYRVRKKSSGTATSSRHINLLCAMGLLNKQYQSKDRDKLLEVNRAFFQMNPDRRMPINVFYFRKYTAKELDRCERRAAALFAAGVTSGNMSFNYLMLNGLEDIAKEVYPNNNRYAPMKKVVEYQDLIVVMDMLIEQNGYAKREQVQDNLLLEEEEIVQLFKVFKTALQSRYYYKRPTKQQKEQWALSDSKYIYTKR